MLTDPGWACANGDYGELITDSGVSVPLLTEGLPSVPIGTRLIVARKFKPLYQFERVVKA